MLLPLALLTAAWPSQLDQPVHVAAAPHGNVLVVQAATGQPIEGAQVYGVHEASAPFWGTFWSRASVQTGADGRGTLPPATDTAPYGWVLVRAEGHAVLGTLTELRLDAETRFELYPEVPARVELVDYTGRPLPLVHLGVCFGCGHTPDVTSAVTDRNGRAVLHGVGLGPRGIADVYPIGADVLHDYLHIDWEAAFDGVFRAVAQPGALLTGTVLDADGRPLVGVAVGAQQRHRGPWAETDERGEFRLFGVSATLAPDLQVHDAHGNYLASFAGSRVGTQRLLRLPPAGADPRRGEPPAPVHELRLELTTSEDRAVGAALGLGPVPVEAWDPASGWSTWAETGDDGSVTLQLIAGEYEVEVGGKGSAYAPTRLGRVRVGDADEPSVLRHSLAPVRVVELLVHDVSDGEVHVLTLDGARRKLTFDPTSSHAGTTRSIARFAVPSQRFGVVLASDDRERPTLHLMLAGLDAASPILHARRP